MNDVTITEEQLESLSCFVYGGFYDEYEYNAAKELFVQIRKQLLSSALEESYKNGFNDGQAEATRSAPPALGLFREQPMYAASWLELDEIEKYSPLKLGQGKVKISLYNIRHREIQINCSNCGVPKRSDGTPNCPDECAFSQDHDAAIRKAERERVLDKLLEWNKHDRSITEIMITRSHEWWHRRFKETIESLRSKP